MKKIAEKITTALVGLDSQIKALLAAASKGMPTLLIGDAATGKTSVAYEVGRMLGRKVVRVNLDGGITPDQLIGRLMLKGSETFFQRGILPQAMIDGTLLVLDEINAALPDTLFAIHPMLEKSPRLFIPETGETIEAAPGFAVIATMNPSHDYAGTKGLNAALYSRFTQVLRFAPLKGDTLVKALALHASNAAADDVLTVARLLELAANLRATNTINTLVSLRDGIAALTYASPEGGLTLTEAIEVSILGKLEKDERSQSAFIEFQGRAPRSLGFPSVPELLLAVDGANFLAEENARLNRQITRMKKLKELIEKLSPAAVDGVETI